MANNYDDYSYEESNDSGSGLGKKILIVVLIVIAILIIIYLLKGCTNGNGNIYNPGGQGGNGFDYETTLLNGGKSYYENNSEYYPTSIGDCTQVELGTLIDKGLVNANNFTNCNRENTYVRVCILPNGNRQYTPWLACSDKNSDGEYSPLTEGTINNIIVNKTYVDFKFLPQVLGNQYTSGNLGKVEEIWKDEIQYEKYKTLATTTYYRYRDKLYTWDVTTKTYYTSKGDKTNAADVDEYYVTTPNSNYKLNDSKTTEAYKWYTTTATKVYALGSNGSRQLSMTAIGEYTNPEGGVIQPFYRTRQITGTHRPYLYNICSDTATGRYVIYQTAQCGQGAEKTYTYKRGTAWSCADPTKGNESIYGQIVSDETVPCNTYGDWSKWSTTVCDTSKSSICEKKDATFYYWYKWADNGEKKYYPSGSKTAVNEKVYYTSAPVSGAIKDLSTKATAYKWYKESKKTTTEYTAIAPKGYASADKTSNFKYGEWSSWQTTNPKVNDGRSRTIETKTKIKLQQILGTDSAWTNLLENDTYITKDEMIKAFNSKGYKVNSLEDINNNGEIRYQVKMYIRNKREN